ncbi:EbsC protein [Trypanosoma grayi]|uniref:EbsC protein n=1 Tax=Trypanosoma grayi TaxID=71804 RepID=UPI0004F41C93|nr:EbsC protein [Trypanosoma grayi]KEG11864.1 EbsC protein [Trypanosoma grayi]
MSTAAGTERVRQYFLSCGADHLISRMREFPASSATVELAAQQLNCTPSMIAKSISFTLLKKKEGVNYQPLLIIASGDAKIDAKKYRAKFERRPEMIKREDVDAAIGFAAGGVCPFGVNDGVRVYLDVSLRRFPMVYPAAGAANSVVLMSIEELEQYSHFVEWIDVCDGWTRDETANGETEASPQQEQQQ